MPTVTWDATFEANPEDSDDLEYGAEEIRSLKLATSERAELEHNFKTGTQPFHKGGKCSVVYLGTTAEINALTDMGGDAHNVTLAWDTTLKVLKYYNGSAWTVVDADHGLLSGKGDDDHTQYLHLNKAAQSIAQSILMGAAVTIDGMDPSGHQAGAAQAQHTAGLGNIVLASAARAVNTIYLAAVDLLVTWYIEAPVGAYGYVNLLVDNFTPPTSIVMSDHVFAAYHPRTTITFPVMKGYYYKAEVPAGGVGVLTHVLNVHSLGS